jgi:hypothetical protein
MPSLKSPSAMERRAAAAALRASEPSSWGSALQRYEASRTQPAHLDALLHPAVPSKTGVFNKTHVPVSFNPLRQTYVEESKEQSVRAAEHAAAAEARQRAQRMRDHLANEHGYDIVSGARRDTTNAALAAKLTREDTSHPTRVSVDPATGQRNIQFNFPPSHPPVREYNILNNTPVFEGSAARLAAAEARRLAAAQASHSKAAVEGREYDIVSTKYHVDHARRAHEESLQNEAQLRDRFYAQAHYNPVALQFVNAAEEKRWQEERAAAAAKHGQAQLAAWPASMKRSEGLLYDIVAPARIKDAPQLAQYYELPERAARLAHQRPHESERLARARDATADSVAARRSAARISTQRYEAQLRRGFDAVTNAPFANVAHAPPPLDPDRTTTKIHLPAKECQPAIGWARLQAQAGGRPPAGKVQS